MRVVEEIARDHEDVVAWSEYAQPMEPAFVEMKVADVENRHGERSVRLRRRGAARRSRRPRMGQSRRVKAPALGARWLEPDHSPGFCAPDVLQHVCAGRV